MPDIWGAASIIVKFLLYAGVLGATGIVMIRLVFAALVAPIDSFMHRGAFAFFLLALITTFASYAVRGAMLTGDASGMADIEMLRLLWDTPVGAAFATRLTGLLVLVVGLFFPGTGPGAGRWIAMLGGIITLWSFTQIGHVPDHGTTWLSLLLLLHLVGLSFWIGVLPALARLTKDRHHLHLAATLGQRFGTIAALIVPALIVAGGIMLWRLTGGIDVIVGTTYGRAILLKLAVVGALLALAAANKLRFVPAMQAGDADAARHLSRSITFEWLAILIILLVTATLTSILSLPT